MSEAPLIAISGLSVGTTSRSGETIAVLRDFSLDVRPGETVGLVGESGSGKSTAALAAMGYLKRGLRLLGGSARFAGHDMFALPSRKLDEIRGGRLALIPQNSGLSLTPNLRIGAQIAEALRLHSRRPRRDHGRRAIELLRRVRLPDPDTLAGRYPHELSGGQQQRAAIAMALAGEPEALLLDEPTTGLDVTTQVHILELLREVRREEGMAMVYISHDLGAIAHMCDRIVVMYAGEAVLEGPARRVLDKPAHPYARALLASIPRLHGGRLPSALEGRPPPPSGSRPGCAFAERCAEAQPECRTTPARLERAASGVLSRCMFHDRLRERPEVEALAKAPYTPSSEKLGLLRLDGLAVSYAKPGLVDQLLGRKPSAVATVDGIDLALAQGETLALVGESGSGKSTILKAIAGLIAPARGEIEVEPGERLADTVERRRAEQLRRIQIVFQNPDESLNPRHTIAEILAQPLSLYFGLKGSELTARSVALLELVRLGEHYLPRLPAQLSGGEKQRVAIARAFAAEPTLVLCDEVTSALDVSVQAAVLALLDRLRREKGSAYLFVSHDLAVVRAIADRVAVLYQGRLCEVGPTASVYAPPHHPYTEALLGAVLEPDPDARPLLLAEDVVELSPPARGCPFQRRCHRRLGEVCQTTAPPPQTDAGGRVVRCHIPLAELGAAQSALLRSQGPAQ